MLVKVLRPIPAGPVTHLPGEVHDAGGWANLRDLIAAELIRPLTPDEAAAAEAAALAEAEALAQLGTLGDLVGQLEALAKAPAEVVEIRVEELASIGTPTGAITGGTLLEQPRTPRGKKGS